MGLYISAVLVLSYVSFVFFAENLNPFGKPSFPMFRARWRYGRRMAFATLASGFVGVILYEVLNFEPAAAGTAALFEFVLFWAFFTRNFKRVEM